MTPSPASSATSPILELHGLSRSFGGVRVIEKLDLAVAGGEIVGLLGPNGAGKSTLFNLIAGVLSPDAGSITYQTRDISRMKVWKRRRLGVGRTYQIPKPFTHMSVYENVLVGAVHGAGLSIRAARETTLDTLELTGLAGSMASPAGALSLLDLKRLELARAIASRPALLLLDEIAGGLTEGECDALLSILGASSRARRHHRMGGARSARPEAPRDAPYGALRRKDHRARPARGDPERSARQRNLSRRLRTAHD